MNWINNVVRPKIRGILGTKREVPDNMWVKDPESGQLVLIKDLEENQFVFPGSNYHERMTAPQRLAHVFDDGEFSRVAVPPVPVDPLKFRDSIKYPDRLKEARAKTDLDDSVLVGEGKLDGQDIVAAAHDMRFVGGSLGMAAGQAVITGMLRAVEKKTPFILFAASGGARMQEGIMSLMQMPRTTIAVQRLRDERLPYLVVLTDPTTGGVTASYAMLGDVHIAEPGALICFAGPRVIQQTIREQLPEGFQRAEYLLAHGMVDMVVHRHKMKETLARLCRLLMANNELVQAMPKEKRQGKAVNGHAAGQSIYAPGHVNGSADARLIETAKKDAVAEPVTGAQRFEAGKASAKGAASTPPKNGAGV